jgi:hypothetical protein
MPACRWCTIECSRGLCDECFILKQNIIKNPNDISEKHCGFYLNVTYEVEERSHDGYCSDHMYDVRCDIEHEVIRNLKTKQCIYPLPRFMIETNFDADGNLKSSQLRSLYKKAPRHEHNGWCEDCKNYYKIVKIQLIRPFYGNMNLPFKQYNWRN